MEEIYSDKWQSNEKQVRKEPADHKEWGRQEVQGTEQVSIGASASTDAKVQKKKISLCPPGGDTTRRLNINREDLWELKKKRQPAKNTSNCHMEANDQAWDLNPKTEQVLETLAILYARFEQVNSALAKADKEFDTEFAQRQDEMDKVKEAQRLAEISAQAVHDGREEYHRLASDFDEAEGTLKEGLGDKRDVDWRTWPWEVREQVVGVEGMRGLGGFENLMRSLGRSSRVFTRDRTDGQCIISCHFLFGWCCLPSSSFYVFVESLLWAVLAAQYCNNHLEHSTADMIPKHGNKYGGCVLGDWNSFIRCHP